MPSPKQLILGQPLVLLAAHRLLGELATNAGRLDDAHRHLTVSLDLAIACGAPFEQALTLMALAELRAAEGNRVEAAQCAAEVRSIAEPLGAVPLLTRATALSTQLAEKASQADTSSRLSIRETEVLQLVAAGKSNAGDRRRALHQSTHRHHASDPHLRQTRSRKPGRGGRIGTPPWIDLIRIDREIRMAIGP